MSKLGVLLEGLPANLTVTYAQQAEVAGFGRIWLPEITFTDAMVPATAAAIAGTTSSSDSAWSASGPARR